MTHTKKQGKTVGELIEEMSEEMLRISNDEIVGKIIRSAETSDTNSSLMVYTSSVNRTNIEDRTMNTQEAISEVRQAIYELETKLQNEVRKVGSTLIFAQLSAFSNAPHITAEIFTPEWDKQHELQEQHVKAVNKGHISQEVDITLRSMASFGKDVAMNAELMDAVEAFEDYVFATYALPIQKLQAKRHNLQKLRDAERNL